MAPAGRRHRGGGRLYSALWNRRRARRTRLGRGEDRGRDRAPIVVDPLHNIRSAFPKIVVRVARYQERFGMLESSSFSIRLGTRALFSSKGVSILLFSPRR